MQAREKADETQKINSLKKRKRKKISKNKIIIIHRH
jgi:hypothetical protein